MDFVSYVAQDAVLLPEGMRIVLKIEVKGGGQYRTLSLYPQRQEAGEWRPLAKDINGMIPILSDKERFAELVIGWLERSHSLLASHSQSVARVILEKVEELSRTPVETQLPNFFTQKQEEVLP